MANQLKDLVVKEISFCQKGAVPGAVISVYKSMDDEPSKEDLTLLEKVGKYFGLNPKVQKSAEPAKVEKGAFADAWSEKEMRSNFYDAFWTLDDVVWGIMQDEGITDKAAAIASACSEFATLVPKLLNIDSTAVAKLLEVRKSAVMPARSQIEKAFVPPVEDKPKEETPVSKGGEEDMTPEERAQLVADITKAVVDGLNIAEVVKTAVAAEVAPVKEEVGKVQGKVEEIGKMAPGSQQQPGQETVGKTDDKNFWKGVL